MAGETTAGAAIGMALTRAPGIRYYRRHGQSGPVFHSSEVKT